MLGDGKWAITCDSLGQVEKLEYDDIHWRDQKQNTLLAGTIRSTLSGLLNPAGIVNILKSKKLPHAGS